MSASENNNYIKIRRLCFRCVGEAYLSAEFRRDGIRRKCSYCGKIANSCSIEELSKRVEVAFEQHYIRTSNQPNSWQQSMLGDRESNYKWDRDGEQSVYAIMNAANLPEKAAEDIQQVLENKFYDFHAAEVGEETEFSNEAHYEKKVRTTKFGSRNGFFLKSR
jgi:hypothetical protein